MDFLHGRIELRENGFWAIYEGRERGPYEFMTSALMALFVMAQLLDLAQQKEFVSEAKAHLTGTAWPWLYLSNTV